MMYKKDPKFLTQVQYCEQQAVPLMVVVGDEEMKNGGVKVRDVKTQKEVQKDVIQFCILMSCAFFTGLCKVR